MGTALPAPLHPSSSNKQLIHCHPKRISFFTHVHAH